MLDSEEYLHLAIHASQHNQQHAALEYLHHVLNKTPQNATAIFLQSAIYAEIGLTARAITGLRSCIQIDPSLDIAYYQLGLLYLQTLDNSNSISMWKFLAESGKDAALKSFAQGMLLLEAKRDEAIILLRQGVELVANNLALKQSMDAIVSKVDATNSDISSSEPVHSLYLNAYKHASFNTEES